MDSLGASSGVSTFRVLLMDCFIYNAGKNTVSRPSPLDSLSTYGNPNLLAAVHQPYGRKTLLRRGINVIG